MNYFPFHVGDYAAHTAHLEPLEDLAYRRMLDAYYLREGPLPSDPREVARLIRMRSNMEEIESVLSEFFVLTESGWTHARCDAEIARMKDKQTKARASAEASVSARKANVQRVLSERSANVERTLSDRSADVELPTPTPTPTPTANAIDAPQSAAKKRGSRLCDDWVLPKPWGEWALSQFPHWSAQEIRTESEKFRDFWVSKSGKDAAKLDWEATWRNWCRNSKKSSDVTHSETPYARHMRERVSEAAGSFAHIVAAKPPGQTYQQPKAPWEIAIENKRRAAAIGMGGCDLLETVDQVREGLPIEVRGPGPIGGEG